jgi:hypothetical protein
MEVIGILENGWNKESTMTRPFGRGGMLWPPGKRSSMRRTVVRPRVQLCLPCLGLHCLSGLCKIALIPGSPYDSEL